jgi:HK97 family phage portal protein
MGILTNLWQDRSSTLADPAPWLFEAFGARSTFAGVSVTPENSLETTSVWAAVRMISSTLATLPLPVFRHVDGGKVRARDHALYKLLHDRPNPEMSSFVWRETGAAHLLLYGSWYNEIERNGAGQPVNLWPLHPAQVRTERLQNGAKVFIVRVDGQDVPLSADNILHVPGFSLDGQGGLIPVHLARNAIGLSRATEEFGSRFFSNGASPSGVLSHPAKLGEKGQKLLRDSWNTGLSNSHRIAILEEGMSWTPLGVPPEHAQFLETRKFSVAEIARLFLIPPHLIGDLERATFSNIEHQAIQYVTHCIEPWTRRIEQELNFRLFGDDPAHFAEFILEGLLRGDSTARGSFYAQALAAGWMTTNEVRERENLNRIDGGDVPRVQLNTAPMNEGADG